jgi:solute carrier family 44 (choline transporter-like protein), member 2/4/5
LLVVSAVFGIPSKFAFIIIATKGKSFCPAAVQAVALIASNVKQVAVVESITSMLFFLGKIFIVCVCGLVGFAWLERAENYQPGGEDELSSQLIPLALLVIIAYGVASSFLAVYQLAIDTILVCFCEDLSCRKGTADEPYFMSDNLKKIIGATTDVSVTSPKTLETGTTEDESGSAR